MTTTEFSNEFDVLLNSYNNRKETGQTNSLISIELDEYEKSVFLTRAQEEVVRGVYNGKLTGVSFETTEEVRQYIDEMVKVATGTATQETGLSSLSYIFSIPTEVWFPTYEQVTFNDTTLGCKNGTIGIVKPVTQDEYYSICTRNPFKGPNTRRVLRMSLAGDKVEIISKYKIGTYTLKYLIKPTPIILEALPTGLSINGVSIVTECILDNPVVQRLILERAVQLARFSRLSMAAK